MSNIERLIVVGLITLAAALTPATARANNFGRLLPALAGFTTPTNQQLADLAQTQLDPNLDSENNPGMLSGFTYLGQALDHDITSDPCCPVPLDPVDPTTITNARTFKFDLDDLYGRGPDLSPQLFDSDGIHLRIQEPNANGVRDVPRTPDGTAIIGDPRNDENEIIGQLQVALIKFHNATVDAMPQCRKAAKPKKSEKCFERAQEDVLHYYQWVIVHEFLPHIVGQANVNRFLDRRDNVRCELFCRASFTPVEFSVAAYRFGHSMVRKAYEVNETTGKIPVFSATEPDLVGGRPIPAGREIFWGNFFPQLVDPEDADGANISRKIDQLLSGSLFALHIPGAEAAGDNRLGFRNMLRAKSYGLPSYEDVARTMHITPVDTGVHAMPGFETDTPLWYGILAESSQVANGVTLGPTGGRIVAETFLRILKDDSSSILNTSFKPAKKLDADKNGQFTMSDLLVDAGVAELPDA
jgi:hypothetical protein